MRKMKGKEDDFKTRKINKRLKLLVAPILISFCGKQHWWFRPDGCGCSNPVVSFQRVWF